MKTKTFHTTTYDARHEAGISLVEILVTVLILAVGSLGIASLQLAGLKYSSGSYARTQVTILSDDMANRLKSNRVFALNQNADGTFGNGSPYVIADFTGAVAVARNCITDECDQQQLADYDIASWANEIARTIPSGRGRLLILDTVVNGLPDRQFSIQLQWRQVANSSTPEAADDAEIRTIAYRISL